MAQKNSFISLLEQIAQLNKNSVEVITKLNDVVASDKNSVSVNYQGDDGRVSKFELPTVGWLKKEIDIANSNIKKLATLEGDNSVVIIDQNNSSRKIKSIDLTREPDQITQLAVSTSFKQNNNWFFESLINPSLTVELNLSDQINDNVHKVLSRRYIVKFERDADGNLTANGSTSKTSFDNTFLNKNDFTIETFLTWMNNPTNYGVIKTDENLYKDEQYFDINYKEINYKGYFSVLKLERDDVNNKLWYHLNTLTYYDRNGGSRILATGDVLSVTSKSSFSKYRITEVNTSNSNFRIMVERIEGYDPIPIGISVLGYYSTVTSQNAVNISIGFDEYNVIFIKPINTETNVICSDWSKGMCFYSNDLVLNTDSNVSMSDFYINSVYDYGVLLYDMVAKKIPSQYASKPNKPTLLTDNFKVVQINKHLTDTKDLKTLKKLHSQKNSVKSKLSEISDSITQKNMELNTKVFKSIAEKSRSQNELNKLIMKQESDTKLYSSYVNQITNSTVETNADPKFRVRGFWEMPSPIIKSGYKPQEVIGFEIQYRYGSKIGNDNTTDGFELKSNTNSVSVSRKKTAYFSQWNTYKTDIRKRTYDEATGKWTWEIEDVSDADTPNINQLDISIQKSEKIDVRIRSISEVGYPDAPLFSDWCDVLSIDFPEELNDITGENQFIIKEATQEEISVNFDNNLSSKGITKHVSESFYVNEQYFGHSDKTISTSFKDAFGNTLSLFDYLKQMNDKISALEESIKRAKGELKVTLFKGTQETEITNGSIINVVINCEDYMISSTGFTSQHIKKSFQNNVYLVNDYYLEIENIATENDLGLFSSKLLSDFGLSNLPNQNKPTLLSDDGALYTQHDYQYMWLADNANVDGTLYTLYNGDISNMNLNTKALTDDFKNIGNVLQSPTKLLDSSVAGTLWWSNVNIPAEFGATVHPYIQTKNPGDAANETNLLVDKNSNGIHIVEAQKTEKVPLQIYFKPNVNNDNNLDFSVTTTTTPKILKKAVKFHIDEESSNRPFEFTVVFKLIRHRQFAIHPDFVSKEQNVSSYKKYY